MNIYYLQVCPAGFYCLNSTITPVICPMGSYCPANTMLPTQYLCPVGTYSNISGIYDISECSDCPAGYSCETSGIIAPSRQCQAGYFCGGGSITSAPEEVTYITNVFSSSNAAVCLSKHGNYSLNGRCPPGNNNFNIFYLYDYLSIWK